MMKVHRGCSAWRGHVLALLLLTTLAGLSACMGAEKQPAAASERELVVFAASSLKEAFGALADDFKQANPGVAVTFNFAGSQELRTQIEHGAPADVFASADQRHTGELVKASRVTGPVIFARNEPVIVVAKGAAATIKTLADLPAAARIVVGAPEVPIGRYTQQILDKAAGTLGADFRAKVEAKVVSRELNVRQVLAKVTMGEADAGIVYRTDAATARDSVVIVTIPPEQNVIAEYPIAVVTAAAHPNLARAWVELVRSPRGQELLERVGFIAPGGAPSASP